jgi:hypothetical protein
VAPEISKFSKLNGVVGAVALYAGFYCGFGLSALAFPCIAIGLLVLPLCGAALTFFAAAKKVSKESRLTPPV